jgi:hypothetical protein
MTSRIAAPRIAMKPSSLAAYLIASNICRNMRTTESEITGARVSSVEDGESSVGPAPAGPFHPKRHFDVGGERAALPCHWRTVRRTGAFSRCGCEPRGNRNRLTKPKSKRPALCRASRGTGRRDMCVCLGGRPDAFSGAAGDAEPR